MLDEQDFNDLTKEDSAIDKFAFAIVQMMEATAEFKAMFDALGFKKGTQDAFEKGLNKCIAAITSSVPNQYQRAVFHAVGKLARNTMNEMATPTGEPAPTEENAEQAITPPT